MLKRKTELFFQWELLLGSFNIIIALKHWFTIDLGPENVPPLSSAWEKLPIIFYILLFSFLLHWQRDFVTFLSSVFLCVTWAFCVTCYLCVHQWGLWCPWRQQVPWEGLTRRLLRRWYLQEPPHSVSVLLTASNIAPCIFPVAVLQGQPRWLRKNFGKQAKQLREWTQVVRPPEGLEQHRLRQLQPQPQAGHDQDGEFRGHHGAQQGWQHVQ